MRHAMTGPVVKCPATGKYTWDADHQPRYEDILAERINRTQNAAGFTLNDPSGSDAETVLSVGWNFPVAPLRARW